VSSLSTVFDNRFGQMKGNQGYVWGTTRKFSSNCNKCLVHSVKDKTEQEIFVSESRTLPVSSLN
jgi:hypothetical protein